MSENLKEFILTATNSLETVLCTEQMKVLC